MSSLDAVVGPYRLLRALGEGSFSRVMHAIDERDGSEVALKLFHAKAPGDGFVREAGVTLDLTHPNVLSARDMGYSGSQLRWVALEYLPGGTLRSRMGGALPHRFVRHVVLQIARALGALHARGIVHRDLKPENVLLGGPEAYPRVVLGDLGTAENARDSLAAGDVGSPAYMAPEQIRGACDARADLYALGVMVFEMIAGRRPFAGAPREVLEAHLHATPDSGDLPELLRPLIASALAKDPAARPSTAYAFARAVDHALSERAEPEGRALAIDPRSDWTLERIDDRAFLRGEGVPEHDLAVFATTRAVVSAAAPVRVASIDDGRLTLGVGAARESIEVPSYGIAPVIALLPFCGAICSSASPSALDVRGPAGLTRRALPAPLSEMIAVAWPSGEAIVGLDLQRTRLVLIRPDPGTDAETVSVREIGARAIRIGCDREGPFLETEGARLFSIGSDGALAERARGRHA